MVMKEIKNNDYTLKEKLNDNVYDRIRSIFHDYCKSFEKAIEDYNKPSLKNIFAKGKADNEMQLKTDEFIKKIDQYISYIAGITGEHKLKDDLSLKYMGKTPEGDYKLTMENFKECLEAHIDLSLLPVSIDELYKKYETSFANAYNENKDSVEKLIIKTKELKDSIIENIPILEKIYEVALNKLSEDIKDTKTQLVKNYNVVNLKDVIRGKKNITIENNIETLNRKITSFISYMAYAHYYQKELKDIDYLVDRCMDSHRVEPKRDNEDYKITKVELEICLNSLGLIKNEDYNLDECYNKYLQFYKGAEGWSVSYHTLRSLVNDYDTGIQQLANSMSLNVEDIDIKATNLERE